MDREEFGSKCIVSGREGRKFEVGTCAQERKWYRECTGIFSHVQAVQRSLAVASSMCFSKARVGAIFLIT